MTSALTYAVLGAARSGVAVATLLRSEGAAVFVSDAKPAEASADERLRVVGAEYEFGGHTSRVLECDVLVLSPGVPDTIPIVIEARERGMRILSEVEIASCRCRAPIVAITGTNGKTTTTELAGHIFRTVGRRTFVAGNVGLPFSEIAREADEASVVVLELSSFQLEHIDTLRPRVAVVLNVTPDHMDRYADFDAYREAKFRVAMNQESDDVLVLNADDTALDDLARRSAARVVRFSIERSLTGGAYRDETHLVIRPSAGKPAVPVIPLDEIRIRGPHNLYNAMAATLAGHALGVDVDAIADALRTFPGVPHRLESVRVIDGVQWVNDSKATNVDSLWYALSSFDSPIVLIAGGRGKRNVYDALLSLVRERVKAMVLVGDTAEEMAAAFAALTSIHRADYSMEQAVRIARGLAAPGDVVLLSPACASFDMFDNYEHRGDVFKSLVNAMAATDA